MPFNCGLNCEIIPNPLRQVMTKGKGLQTGVYLCQDITKMQCTRHRKLCLWQVLINTKQKEDFEQYVLNFLYVSMIQNVLCFLLFLVKGRNIKML